MSNSVTKASLKCPLGCAMFNVSIYPFRSDVTETGYTLGDPDHRGPIRALERSLPPAACAILRALMHCSLLWASCNNEVRVYNSTVQCNFIQIRCN